MAVRVTTLKNNIETKVIHAVNITKNYKSLFCNSELIACLKYDIVQLKVNCPACIKKLQEITNQFN